jgi:hypothetical protein
MAGPLFEAFPDRLWRKAHDLYGKEWRVYGRHADSESLLSIWPCHGKFWHVVPHNGDVGSKDWSLLVSLEVSENLEEMVDLRIREILNMKPSKRKLRPKWYRRKFWRPVLVLVPESGTWSL